MFKVEFTTTNVAFDSAEGDTEKGSARAEIARILRLAAIEVEDGYDQGILRDYNGSDIGTWEWKP